MNVNGISPYSAVNQAKSHKAVEHNRRDFQDAFTTKTFNQMEAKPDSIILVKSEQVSDIETVKPIEAESVKASVCPKIEYNWYPIQFTTNQTTIAKLTELREVAEKTDYTGMTPAQVLKEIHDRYNDAFGGNILVITTFVLSNGREWGDINSQYNREMDAAFQMLRKEYPSITEVDAFREMMGYGGLQVNEVEAAIIKKYEGKDTTFDFMSMMGEMLRSGALDRMGDVNGSSAKFIFIEKLGYGLMGRFSQSYNDVSNADVENMFRSKINFNALLSEGTLNWKFLNAFVLSGTAERADNLMNELLNQLFSNRNDR